MLRGETNFFVRSLRHYFLLIFYKTWLQNQNPRITWQVFSKYLRNQRTLRYQKNSLWLLYNSTETLVKTSTLNLFEQVHYPNFLSSSSDLMQPSFWGFFSLWRLCQKVKRPWRRVRTWRHRSKPLLTQDLRVLFRMWIIWKISTIILFKRNIAEKDICRTHVLCDFLHRWWLLKVKKNK